MKFIVSLLVLCTSAFAAETLTLQENVDSKIYGTTADKFELLKKQHAAQCDQWLKASPFHVVRPETVQSSTCSKGKFDKLTVSKKVWDCWTEIHPQTGQSIEYCGDQWKTEHVGYYGRSIGTRVVQLPAYERGEEELTSESFVGEDAKAKAWTDFQATCKDWLKSKQAQIGTKLLFAGCRGAEKDTLKYSSEGDIARYDALGVILTERP